MRRKALLSIILSAVMILGSVSPAFAAGEIPSDEVAVITEDSHDEVVIEDNSKQESVDAQEADEEAGLESEAINGEENSKGESKVAEAEDPANESKTDPAEEETLVGAAQNPYGMWQDVDGDGNNEIRCTYFAWQQVYDNTGIALPGWGDAGTWLQSAMDAGYATGDSPQPGAIAVWSGGDGGYGHVAYVTSGSGNTFTVNEGGRTDLDHTSSQGVEYGYTLTNAVGSPRPYESSGTQILLGFIYPGNDIPQPGPHGQAVSVGENVTAGFDSETGTVTFYSQGGTLSDDWKNMMNITWSEALDELVINNQLIKAITISNDSDVMYLPVNSDNLFEYFKNLQSILNNSPAFR